MAFKKFWNLAKDTTDETALNMYVYGEICSASSFFGSEDDVVASKFVEDLNNYQGIQTINVYINSPGGSVFAAAAIINQLRKHTACVHTWCDGICASAAVGILLAANEGCRHMSRATLLMIHNPSTKVQGDQKTFLKTADLLAKVKNTIVDIYHTGTGLDKDRLSAMMDDETYLSAEDAKALNFVDSITEDEITYDFKDQGSLICNGVTLDVAAHLDVEALKKHLATVTNSHILNEGRSEHMNFDEFMNSLSEETRQLVQNAFSTQEQAHAAALQAANDANATLEARIAELTAQLETRAAADSSTESAIIDQMPDEAKALLAQARADAIAAQNALAQVQEAQAFAEFKNTFAEFSNLPLTDTHIKAMQNLAKSNDSMYAELRELLKVANNAMGAGFAAIGSDQGTEIATDAYDLIEQRVKAFRDEHPGASYNDALKDVLRNDPGLYDSYRNSQYFMN